MLDSITNLQDIASRYDAFLVDAWGVLHDGVTPYGGAITALSNLKAAGKSVAIISNASRRISVVSEEMKTLGITPDLYDHIATSGEEAWQALDQRADKTHASLGTRCFYIGPDRSRSLMHGLNLTDAEGPNDADFLLVAGGKDPSDTLEQYTPQLTAARERNLIMVCANSDRIAISGGNPYMCGGTLAAHYTDLGGTALHYGKPFSAIYKNCFAALPGIQPDRILAIGDSFETDIAGAKRAGIDSLFVMGGIHAADMAPDAHKSIEHLCIERGCRPKAAIDLLRW